nr:DoxX family protein [Terribacillus saccharophilus]
MKKVGLYVFSLMFIVAGILHFVLDDGFVAMLPAYVPLRYTLIYLTGIAEILLAIGLLVPTTRKLTAIVTVIYLIAIFPANIYSAVYDIPVPGFEETDQTLLYIRLLAQPALIWWVWKVTR